MTCERVVRVLDPPEPDVIRVPNPPVSSVIRVETPGIQGPPGPASDAIGFDHVQSSASAQWTIAHNLGFRPSVSVFTVGGVEIEGAVQHQSINVLVVSFVVPVAGYAHIV